MFTERDLAKWSWADAIQNAMSGRVSGVVAEADRELRRTYFNANNDTLNRQIGSPHSFLVPNEVLRRDLTAANTGGYLVGVDQVGFLDSLAPMMVTSRLGAKRLGPLVGNVTTPKITGDATAYWIPDEGTAVTETQPTFGQLALTPHTVGAYNEFSRQLLLQSTPAVNKVVAAHIARKVAQAIDAAALAGAGSAEPLGVVNVAGIGGFTGTSLDFAACINAQADLAGANVDPAGAAYATTPAVAALLMARQRFTSTDSPLWTGSLGDGQLAGLRAIASTNMPTATMILGRWEHLLLAEWGAPLEIEVNRFANFATGVVGVRCLAVVDVGVEYPAAFTIASSIT